MSNWRNGKRTAKRGHRDMKQSRRRHLLSEIEVEPDDDSTDGWLKFRAALRGCSAPTYLDHNDTRKRDPLLWGKG